MLVLVSNAAKHSGRGKRVWLRAEGGTFGAEDEGEGISERDLPRVLERHYRGNGGGSGGGGFGLGLPICKDLVQRMGGEISVESVEGVGTTARLTLPEAGPHDRDAGRGAAGGRGDGPRGGDGYRDGKLPG